MDNTTLSSPVAPHLASDASMAYRAEYQSYRMGAAVGVVGENPDDPRRAEYATPLDDDDEDRPHDSVSEAAEKAFNDLLEWRLEYQAYRAGAARGARGRASGKSYPLETLRMLPVARLAAHHRAKAKRSRKEPHPPPPPSSGVHAHVGCGRLGLGLVVPALAKGALARGGKVVLVQRPSSAWKLDEAPLKDGAVVSCRVNDDVVCRLEVCGGGDVAGRLAKSAEGLLVLSTDAGAMDAVAAAATSASCSLGPALAKGLEPLATALGRSKKRVRLYAAENDHDAVEAYAKTDAAKSVFKISPLLVDRVCTGRDLSAESDGSYSLTTTTEPWRGEIVVMRDDDDDDGDDDDGDDDAPLPFGGDGVYAPDSAAAAQFLHRRKILTVNGTHTTLAFLTLAAKEPPPHKGLPKGSYELVRAIPGTPGEDELEDLECEETYRNAWCFAVARQLLLLFESDYEVAAAALTECDGATSSSAVDAKLCDALLSNARAAIDRLGRGGDETARVLGAGVVKRYEGRLLPVAKFLETAAKSSPSWLATPLARLLLRKAKLTQTTLRLAVLGLTADAGRFAEPEPAAAPEHEAPSTPKKKKPPASPARPPSKRGDGPASPRRVMSMANLAGLGGGAGPS